MARISFIFLSAIVLASFLTTYNVVKFVLTKRAVLLANQQADEHDGWHNGFESGVPENRIDTTTHQPFGRKHFGNRFHHHQYVPKSPAPVWETRPDLFHPRRTPPALHDAKSHQPGVSEETSEDNPSLTESQAGAGVHIARSHGAGSSNSFLDKRVGKEVHTQTADAGSTLNSAAASAGLVGDHAKGGQDKQAKELANGNLGPREYDEEGREIRGEAGSNKFHVVVTADHAKYVAWQCRIMYYWYQKTKQQNPGGDMGGFTRLLHSGISDRLVKEIPSVIVDPLSASGGRDHGYVVLNRPNAFRQFLEKVILREDYILMGEPDHIMIPEHPIQNWASPSKPVGFPFFYIDGADERLGNVAKRFTYDGSPLVDPVGNSPVIIHKAQLAQVAPKWHDLALAFKADKQANEIFGWVLEMWAYTIAAYNNGIRHTLRPAFMLQPPWDTAFQLTKDNKTEWFNMIHYTYGQDVNKNGNVQRTSMKGKSGQFHFDKRDWMHRVPPRNLAMPVEGTNPVIVRLMESINEASSHLPYWERGGM